MATAFFRVATAFFLFYKNQSHSQSLGSMIQVSSVKSYPLAYEFAVQSNCLLHNIKIFKYLLS